MEELQSVHSTVNQPVEIVDISKLPVEQKLKVEQILSQINITDSQGILQYGIAAQSNISSFADSILREVKTKDSSYVGEILTDLVLKVKDLDIESISNQQNKGFLSMVPMLKMFAGTAQKFIAKYEKLSTQIEKIINELDQAKLNLLKDLTLLDSLFEKNYEYLRELDFYIMAGTLKLKEVNEQVIPNLRSIAEISGDPLDAQRLNDMIQLSNRFEKKLHDLKLSRTVAIQTAPQIRLIQNNDQVLVEKIQSSLLNTIPLWKNQIVIAITLFRQKKALEVQREVTDTTNELLSRNSDMLKESSLEVAKESERGIVEIETLKKVNADLIQTIEETIRIQHEGRTKRQQAEVELANMEKELKQKLMSIKEQSLK